MIFKYRRNSVEIKIYRTETKLKGIYFKVTIKLLLTPAPQKKHCGCNEGIINNSKEIFSER